MCDEQGRITVATVVDHVTPHRGDQALFWERENWQPLCAPCHNGEKQSAEKGGAVRRTVGADGWPVEASKARA